MTSSRSSLAGVSFAGEPIRIEFRPSLLAHGSRLLSGGEKGSAVHAGSFIRQRLIVLDQQLLSNAAERNRILLHEICHFVWVRFGNNARFSWEALLRDEFFRRVRGEMGWSADCRKQLLRSSQTRPASRLWKEYCCESFCDTAAMELLALDSHDEITLGASARRVRRQWMEERIAGRRLRV